ncbi:helix-turn-helix domain-containing protein [Pseudoxanthomonas sp. PXM02]|uniref:helix-turn-helix domain-containing protein n=1 Tax=Pseudoxanthomonas sp. PXM02 TaxID=2769294 RepID=UPI00178395A9|nr:helix-turn-helix domain-containing protein [Pseudoxanthomonas sp. PXM02]MBD9477670.1 AraC family transcriptional regulator [Pseudoxanthomonas sp. PXM02]
MATGTAVAVATISLLVLLWQRPKRDAEVLFAVVSGSMALSLMSPWMHGAPTWMLWAVAIGGSATCNGFWLVSRALFRGDGGVSRLHVGIAAGVALLIAAYRIASLGARGDASPWASALDSLLTLASSTLLVLSFLEAVRGWSSSLPRSERRLRAGFMATFASCVLSATLVGALPAIAGARAGVIAACVIAIVLFTHVALRHRRRMPLAPPAPVAVPEEACTPDAESPTPRTRPALTLEDTRLAAALQHQLEVLQVYREPELKVLDLAERLRVPEHRLSRLVTQALGEKNFNQLINRHRIAYACRRLANPDGEASILDISGDAGFASLGPFNRAFKAAMDCTPTAYRAACRTQAVEADADDADIALQSAPH